MNKLSFALLIFAFTFGVKMKSDAQTPKETVNFRKPYFGLEGKITLEALTKLIHHNTGVRFSFNSSRVNGSAEITFKKGKYGIKEILKQIQQSTSLYYIYYYGYVVFRDSGFVAQNNISGKGLHKSGPVKNYTKKTYSVLSGSTPQKMELLPNNRDTNLIGEISKLSNLVKINIPNFECHQIEKDTGKIIQNEIVAQSFKKQGIIKNNGIHDLNYGLQWNLNLLSYGHAEYFMGTNGKNQFYNFLIPGIWLSKGIGKNGHEIMVTLKPVQQYFTGNSMVASTVGVRMFQNIPIVQKNIILIKTNSWYTGLQYNYQINEKWSFGGGINFNWQTAALAKTQIIRDSTGIVISDSLYEIKKTSPEWQYLKPTFFSARVEITHQFNKFQLGGALIVPVTGIMSSAFNNYQPVNGHAFLRWNMR